MLSLSIPVWAADDVKAEKIQTPEIINTIDEDLAQVEEDPLEYKQPYSVKKIATKFGAAMAGVLVSSILLYLILSVYNSIRERLSSNSKGDNDKFSLETPEDLNSAIRTFLDKTNWK